MPANSLYDTLDEEEAYHPLVALPGHRNLGLGRHRHFAAKGGHCANCGGTDFGVGDALHLGFLFLDEDDDAYMVALTCRNPDCAKPRTAMSLREKDFLYL